MSRADIQIALTLGDLDNRRFMAFARSPEFATWLLLMGCVWRSPRHHSAGLEAYYRCGWLAACIPEGQLGERQGGVSARSIRADIRKLQVRGALLIAERPGQASIYVLGRWGQEEGDHWISHWFALEGEPEWAKAQEHLGERAFLTPEEEFRTEQETPEESFLGTPEDSFRGENVTPEESFLGTPEDSFRRKDLILEDLKEKEGRTKVPSVLPLEGLSPSQRQLALASGLVAKEKARRGTAAIASHVVDRFCELRNAESPKGLERERWEREVVRHLRAVECRDQDSALRAIERLFTDADYSWYIHKSPFTRQFEVDYRDALRSKKELGKLGKRRQPLIQGHLVQEARTPNLGDWERWPEVLEVLKLTMTKAAFSGWLADTWAELESGRLIVYTPKPWTAEWLDHRLRRVVEQAVGSVLGTVPAVIFAIDERKNPSPPASEPGIPVELPLAEPAKKGAA